MSVCNNWRSQQWWKFAKAWIIIFISETIQMDLQLNSTNKEDGVSLNNIQMPPIHTLKHQKEASLQNEVVHHHLSSRSLYGPGPSSYTSFYPYDSLHHSRGPFQSHLCPLILLTCSGLSSSLGCDSLILFPGLITPFLLYNCLFTSLDTSTLKIEAVSSFETFVNISNTHMAHKPRIQTSKFSIP